MGEGNAQWRLESGGLNWCEGGLATAEGDGRGGFKGEEVRPRGFRAVIIREALPGEEASPEVLLGDLGDIVRDEGAVASAGEVLVGEQRERRQRLTARRE